MEKESVVEKIRKLLALANCKGATDAEAMAAMRRAKLLMEDHQIEEAQVAMDEGRDYFRFEDLGYDDADVPRARTPVWRACLLQAVCALYDCKAINGYTWNDQRVDLDKVMRVCGFPEDRQAAIATYKFLTDRGRYGAGRFHFRRDKGSYLKGFAFRVLDRAREVAEERKRSRAVQTSALAKYDKEAMVLRFMKDDGVRGGGGCRTIRVENDRAYTAGQNDGNRVDLGGRGYERRQIGAG